MWPWLVLVSPWPLIIITILINIFKDMNFDDFMKKMGDLNVDPEEFSEQMLQMADVMMPGEKGST